MIQPTQIKMKPLHEHETKKGPHHVRAFDLDAVIGRDGRIRTDDPLPPRHRR